MRFGVWTLLGSWTILAALLAPESAPAGEVSATGSKLYRHEAADGTVVYGLALQARLPDDAQPRSEHVVIVDTSASQAGEHRQQALAVLQVVLKALPADDRVALFAADVKTEPLTDGFVAPVSPAVAEALTVLENRVPLGATDLRKAVDTVVQSLEWKDAGSVLYIGDGMSAAGLIQSAELEQSLAELRKQRLAVHSYAVGPRTDLQLLGVLAQQTGGVVRFDRADEQRDAPDRVGGDLAAAMCAPVFYPQQVEAGSEATTLFPATPLPLRSDRETIYLATTDGEAAIEVSVHGTMDGRDVALKWTAETPGARTGFPVLGALWKQAQRDDGLSVPLAGVMLLNAAQDAFANQVSGLAGLGEQALKARNLYEAEQLGQVLGELDPQNAQVKALLEATEKVRVRTVSQAQPVPPEENAQPNAAPPNAAPPAGDDVPPGSLLDQLDTVPPELQPGVQPPANLRRDLILTEEQRRQIRSEQLTLEIERSIQQARQLAQDDPEAALGALKQSLGSAVDANDIFPEVQQQLTKRVRSVIQEVQTLDQKLQLDRVRAAERQAQLEAEQRTIEQLLLDEEQLEILIDRVRGLLAEGDRGNDAAFELAEEVAEVAVDLRPGGGVAEAARFTAEAAGALNKAFRLRALRADRFLETLYQVELSHVPFPDEPPIRWPPAPVWQQLSQIRKKWASVDLHKNSPAEERIQAALLEETETGFIDTPLKDAIDFLEELHKIQIIIDEPALVEEGIASDEPINLDISGITLRSALRIMLEPLGLTYIIEDEVMKITTQIKAEDKLQTRVYPVGDLVIPIITPLGGGLGQGIGGVGGIGGAGGFGGGGQFGGGGFGGGGFGGGGFGGGGFFSVPPEQLRQPAASRTQRQPANRPRTRVRNSEVRGILDGILGNATSQTSTPRGQYFAQVLDPMAEQKNVFDNEAVEALKKKAAPTR